MAIPLNQILAQKKELQEKTQTEEIQKKQPLFAENSVSKQPSEKSSSPASSANRYISQPHQLRALQLTQKFQDPTHKLQYLNLCKSVHPTIIDQAESFVSDANANNQAALFMWKVKQIKTEWQDKNKDWRNPDKPAVKKKKKTKKVAQKSLF